MLAEWRPRPVNFAPGSSFWKRVEPIAEYFSRDGSPPCSLFNSPYFYFPDAARPFAIPGGHEIDMLPPFRVRTLRPSASPGLGRSKKKEFNALVRITAPEYDKTLRVCPEATLKYLDEEDGEIVTVWSSASKPYCSVLI